MKKFFKRFAKGCGYVTLYLLVAVGTAVGILFLSPAGKNLSANEVPIQLQQIVNNLESEKALDISLSAQVTTASADVAISGSVQLDLSNGFDKLKVKGNVGVNLGEENFDVDLFYGDGKIFVEALKGKLVMSVDSIGDTLAKVTSLLGVKLPDLGGIDMSSLDLDMVLGILSDLTEIKGKDGIKLVINITMLEPALTLNVFCDNDYNLQRIELPHAEISGTTFGVSATVNRPDRLVLQEPDAEEFIDVSDLMDAATVALGALQADTIGFNVDVTTADMHFVGDLSGDLKNLNAMFETEIADMPLKIAVYKDNMFYLEFGNIYLKFAFADVEKLTDFLAEQFDIHIPIEQITTILAAIQDGHFAQILPALSFGSQLSVDGLDLSVLESLSREDDNFVISLRDIGQISIFAEEQKLQGITFDGLGVLAQVVIQPAKEVEIADVEHADLAQIIPAVNAIINTFKQDSVSGTATINAGDITAYANFKFVPQTKEFVVQANTQLCGLPIKLAYQNEKIFAEVSGLKVSANSDELSRIAQMLDINTDIDKMEFLGLLKNLIDPSKYAKLISLLNGENGLQIGILDKVLFDLKFDDMLTSLKIKADGVDADVNFSDDVAFSQIDPSQYEPATAVIDKVSAVMDYVNAHTFYLTVEGAFDDGSVSGFISYDGKLQAELELVFLGQTARVRLCESELFLDVKDLHFKTDLANWKDLVGLLGTEFGLNLDEILAKFNLDIQKIEDLLAGRIKIDPAQILASRQLADILSKCNMEFENGDIKITYPDIVAYVHFAEDNMIADLDVQTSNFGVVVSIEEQPGTMTPFDPSVQYIEVSDVLRKAGAVLKYVKAGKYYLTLSGAYSDLVAFEGVVNAEMIEGKLQLEAEIVVSAYGQQATVRLFGTELYLDVKDVHVKADLKDWKQLLGIVGEEFGIDFDKLLSDAGLSIEKIDDVLSGKTKVTELLGGFAENADIEAILTELGVKFENDVLTATYNGLVAGVTFVGEDLSCADVTYGDVNAHVDIQSAKQNIESIADASKYVDVKDVLQKAGAVLNYVKGGKYYFTLSGAYSDLVAFEGVVNAEMIEGKLQLEAEIVVTAYGQQATVRLFGTELYLDVKDVHVKADLKDWKEILAQIQDAFGLDLSAVSDQVDGLQDKVNSKQSIEDLLDQLVLSYIDGQIHASVSGAEIDVYFAESNMIDYAEVTYSDLTATLTVMDAKQAVQAVGTADAYVPVQDIIAKAGNVYNLIQTQNIYMDVTVTIDGKYVIEGFVNFDDKDGLSASLSAIIEGAALHVKLLGRTIYLTAANLNLKFDIDDVDTVLNFLNSEFGLDVREAYNQYKWIVDLLTTKKHFTLSDFTKPGETSEEMDIEGLLEKLWLTLKGDVLSVSLSQPELSATITFNDAELSSLLLNVDKFAVSAKLQAKQTVAAEGEYFDVKEILPFISSVKSYVLGKQYDIVANAEVFDGETKIYDAQNIVLQVDALNALQFFADAHVTGMPDTKSAGFDLNLNAAISGEYLYFDYNGLCLKLSTEKLQGILEIACELFGIDPTILTFITGKQSESSGLDMSFLQGQLPGLDFENPLSILQIFTSLSVSEDKNVLSLTLDGKSLTSNERAGQMHVEIEKSGNTLKRIDLTNFYTGVTKNEHFNLFVTFETLQDLKQPDLTNPYVDLTGAEELIKAAINTISHRSFEIKGSLNIDFSLLGFNNALNWNVPLTIRIDIKQDEKTKELKPRVYAHIGPMPVINDLWLFRTIEINNDTTLSSPDKNREIEIYYEDGIVYFYRHETGSNGKQTYEKRLNSKLDTVMNDVLYYVQWATGFGPMIMDAIRESLAKEHTIDLGNVIKSFSVVQDKAKYEIVLNMEEISGDKNMGDMTIGIGLEAFDDGNDETEDLSVIGSLSLSINMPFLPGVVELTLKSADTENKTSDLDVVLDVDMDNDFAGYSDFHFNGKDLKGDSHEFELDIPYYATNGEWKNENEREFVVTFETNREGLSEPSISGTKGTTFDLPNYTQEFEESYTNPTTGIVDGRTIYRFAGWYSDPNFAAGTQVTEGVIPYYNITLYAKWEVKEAWRTITYMYGEQEVHKEQHRIVAGQDTSLLTCQEAGLEEYIEVKSGKQLFKQKFVQWQDKEGNEINFVPDDSLCVYAYYETYETLTEYTLTFDTGVGPSLDPLVVYGGTDAEDIVDASGRRIFCSTDNGYYGKDNYVVNADGVTTTYSFGGWYFDEAFEHPFDGIMPENDLTIYAQWNVESVVHEWNFQIYDNGTPMLFDSDGQGLRLKEGTKILPYSAELAASGVPDGTYMLPSTVKIRTVQDLRAALGASDDQTDAVTQWYFGFENGAYNNPTSLPEIMPNSDLILHIRNKYEMKYTYYESVVNTEYTLENPYSDVVKIGGMKTSTFHKYLWQNETFDLLQTEFYLDSYRSSGTDLQERVEYKFKYSNGLSGSTATVQNEDMIFESQIDNAASTHTKWYYISFNTEFLPPYSAWWIKSAIEKVSEPTAPAKIAILAGKEYTPGARRDLKAVYKYIGVSYDFYVIGWKEGEGQNITNGASNTKDSQAIGTFAVTKDTLLFAVWGK